MAFTLPTFNSVWQAKANFNFALGLNPVGPFILVGSMGNLAYGRRSHQRGPDIVISGAGEFVTLLFDKTIPLKGRDSYAVKNGDAVEVPLGSGRWFSVTTVESVGLGFTNEHKAAMLVHPYVLTALAPLWP